MKLKAPLLRARRAAHRGFTLVELLIVVIILAILAAIVVSTCWHKSDVIIFQIMSKVENSVPSCLVPSSYYVGNLNKVS